MSKSKEEEIKQNELRVHGDLESQSKKTKEIVHEMTQQYKRMEKELQDKIDKLHKKVTG